MTTPELVLTIYLVCINLAAFAVMGADKRRARREAWRIRERTLFLLAIVGGSARVPSPECMPFTTRPATGIL